MLTKRTRYVSLRVYEIIIALLLISACAAKTYETDKARQADKANEIVLRVNELQRAAISANASGAVDVNTTTIIVQFTVDANVILKTIPNGWQATLRTSWTTAKSKFPPNLNLAVKASVDLVDSLIGAL